MTSARPSSRRRLPRRPVPVGNRHGGRRPAGARAGCDRRSAARLVRPVRHAGRPASATPTSASVADAGRRRAAGRRAAAGCPGARDQRRLRHAHADRRAPVAVAARFPQGTRARRARRRAQHRHRRPVSSARRCAVRDWMLGKTVADCPRVEAVPRAGPGFARSARRSRSPRRPPRRRLPPCRRQCARPRRCG